MKLSELGKCGVQQMHKYLYKLKKVKNTFKPQTMPLF